MNHRWLIFLITGGVLSQNISAREIESVLENLAHQIVSESAIKQPATLAILPFQPRGEHSTNDGRAVAEYLITVLQHNALFTIVDRLGFAKLMDEIELSQSDLVSEEGALQAGRILSATYVITGSIGEALGKAKINARLVEVESARVLASASKSIPAEVLDEFVRDILVERRQISASIFRSAVIPGWGQFYTSHPWRGALSLTLFAVCGGLTAFGIIQSLQAKDEYTGFVDERNSISGEKRLINDFCGAQCTKQSPDFNQAEFTAYKQKREDDVYNRYENKKKQAIFYGAILGFAWALNLVDASIAGMESKHKFNLYFSSNTSDESSMGVTYVFYF